MKEKIGNFKNTQNYSYDNSPDSNIYKSKEKNKAKIGIIKGNINNINNIKFTQENDEKEKYDLNNLGGVNLFTFVNDREYIIDMNEDLLNKQKQLKEIEKQIKKSKQKSRTNFNNNIYANANNMNQKNIFNEKYMLSNNSENTYENKIVGFKLNNTNEEIEINKEILNTVNYELVNNTKNLNLKMNKKIDNYNSYNNFMRYDKENIEEDKINLLINFNNNYDNNNSNMKSFNCNTPFNTNFTNNKKKLIININQIIQILKMKMKKK
jgi:hypothetical protein